MIAFIRQHPVALAVAIVIHAVFFAILVLSFRYSRPTTAEQPQVEVVQAVAVDEARVKRELERIKAAERRREQKVKAMEAARKREEKRLAELRRKREAERRRRAELERKRRAEKRRLAELRRKQAEEKKRLAKLEAEKKALAEKRRREQERLAALERQRREAERRRREEAARARAEAELKKKLEAEQQRLAALQAQQRQSEIDRYQQLIYAEVYRNWTVPPGARQGMSAELRVRLIPSGDVVTVDIARSSGDAVFDRSAMQAVRKASPLPVPPVDSGLFEEFRQINLVLRKKET